MADRSTSPGHATRSIETTRGLLTYAELAPLLAERVLSVEQRIAVGDFAERPLDGEFIRSLMATSQARLSWDGPDAGDPPRCVSANMKRHCHTRFLF